jgi:uncharacterized membrane protein YedE/YeeE
MKLLLPAFVSALVFGLGLGISGMTLPSKVLGFLDVTGEWDPSLIAVMLGAILVHSISYRIIKRRGSPLLVSSFKIPTRRDLDWKLVLGSAIFGAGWGLGGFCPGPALVGLVTAQSSVLIFVASMVAGMYLYNIFNSKFLQRKGN